MTLDETKTFVLTHRDDDTLPVKDIRNIFRHLELKEEEIQKLNRAFEKIKDDYMSSQKQIGYIIKDVKECQQLFKNKDIWHAPFHSFLERYKEAQENSELIVDKDIETMIMVIRDSLKAIKSASNILQEFQKNIKLFQITYYEVFKITRHTLPPEEKESLEKFYKLEDAEKFKAEQETPANISNIRYLIELQTLELR